MIFFLNFLKNFVITLIFFSRSNIIKFWTKFGNYNSIQYFFIECEF